MSNQLILLTKGLLTISGKNYIFLKNGKYIANLLEKEENNEMKKLVQLRILILEKL